MRVTLATTLLVLATATLACASILAPPPPAGEWLKPIWRRASTSSNIVATDDGFAVVGAANAYEEQLPTVTSFNLATGDNRWSVTMSVPDGLVPTLYRCAVAAELVFAVAPNSTAALYAALNRQTGAVLWSRWIPLNTEAQVKCPLTFAEPLLLVTTATVTGVAIMTGAVAFTYTGVPAPGYPPVGNVGWLSNCGPKNAPCIVVQPQSQLAQFIQLIDPSTGAVIDSPLDNSTALVMATVGDVVLLAENETNTVARWWNNSVAWTVENSFYIAGDATMWISSDPTSTQTAYSTRTGERLWFWPEPCRTVHTPIPVGPQCFVQFFFSSELPIAATTCLYGKPCSAAAINPADGAVKWVVTEQSFSLASQRYAVFENAHGNTTTVVRVANGMTRLVNITGPVQSMAEGTAAQFALVGNWTTGYEEF